MELIELLIYESRSGRCPYTEWIESIEDLRGRGIIRARINRVALGNLGDCKAVGGGVFELRVHYGPGYRVYFGKISKRAIVLLYGGVKASQNRDIAKAQSLWKDYKYAN